MINGLADAVVLGVLLSLLLIAALEVIRLVIVGVFRAISWLISSYRDS